MELLAYLKKNTNCNLLLVLTKDIVNYSKFFELQIPYIVIQRKYWKKDPSLFFKFYKIAKAFKPDIIHTWSPMVSFYSIPTKVLLRIPMLNYQIQTAREKKIQKIDNYKINYFFSDLIVANSIAGLNAFKTPPKKSKVVYNGFVFDRIQNIAEPKIIKEKLNIDTNAKDALVEVSDGDVRKLENILQACAVLSNKISEDIVFEVAGYARPKEMSEILEYVIKNDFVKAKNKLLDTMLNYGLSGLDVIKQLHKEIWKLKINDLKKLEMMKDCAEIEFRMVEGSDEFLQLESLLARLVLINSKN
ncbi:TPA: hypothetical protein HA363_05095 [Candidatus Woesearchaeota archaeon]|nr:hypothetical protein [Candidatus Woesearchaeota archaeon]